MPSDAVRTETHLKGALRCWVGCLYKDNPSDCNYYTHIHVTLAQLRFKHKCADTVEFFSGAKPQTSTVRRVHRPNFPFPNCVHFHLSCFVQQINEYDSGSDLHLETSKVKQKHFSSWRENKRFKALTPRFCGSSC